MTKTDILKNIILNSKHLVFFGGAGVSTASKIPDFRSSNGIYNEKYGTIPIETIISHSFFMSNPEIFYNVYKEKLCFPNAQPNDCHLVLAKLEKMGILKSIITQNIDDLHEKAGSKNILKLHGSVTSNHCMKCSKQFGLSYILNSKGLPLCDNCKGLVKPDVVLYEEPLDYNTVEKAISEISKADTLIIGGTSLVVYPAAYYIEYFKGKNLVIINMSETSKDKECTLVIHDDIAKVFRELNIWLTP